MDYGKLYSTKRTPQSLPIPGSTQVCNSAGGHSWAVDDWTRLDRFLILGSEGGSYYTSERALTAENAEGVRRCLGVDGLRVVDRIVEVSTTARAPKNDPAIFALAMALKLGDDATRRAARSAVPKVCRIGTHLFTFAGAVEAFGGWGRGTRGAFQDWYLGMDPDRLANQLIKYQRRNGWSHRDVLRLCKPRGHERGGNHDRLLAWATGKADGEVHPLVDAFEAARRAESSAASAALIRDHGLPRECIRTDHLDSPDVWEALLDNRGHGMPLTAMLRNLGKMSAVGLLAPLSDAADRVIHRMRDADALMRARIHPLQVLVALSTYRSGAGVRGNLTWDPVGAVVDALDDAFYTTFGAVETANKRTLLALDVSGSMSWGAIAGMTGITPRVGSAAMAMVTEATEPRVHVCAFSHEMVPLNGITSGMRLDAVIDRISNLPFGATDCARPMIYALDRGLEVDTFVVYTDSETWSGNVHPTQALREYRDNTGIPARLIVVGMLSNGFTIADPDDPGMLDVVGFDTASPGVMAAFSRGDL